MQGGWNDWLFFKCLSRLSIYQLIGLMSKSCWWVKCNEWNPAAVGGQKQPDAATGWRSVNVIGLDTSSSSPSCSSAHSRFKNLFVQLSPASSYLVTQDWCNRMQSGSLARSITHSLPPPTFSFSSRFTHLWLFLSQSITPDLFFFFFSLYLSICLIVQSSPSLSLSRSFSWSHTLSTHGWGCCVQVDLCSWTR